MRCFIGIEIPRDIKRSLSDTAERLSNILGPRYRRIPEENFHITVKFLGDIELPVLRLLTESLGQRVQRAKALDFTIDTLSGFPSAASSRVIWAGGETTTGLLELVHEVERAAVDLGLPEETRPFTPHITLLKLRNRQKPASMHEMKIDGALLTPSLIPIRRLCLYASEPIGDSVSYRVVEAFPFIS
jgi:2'-5' RNA ligase